MYILKVNNWFINARERVIKKFMKNDVNNVNFYEGVKPNKNHSNYINH